MKNECPLTICTNPDVTSCISALLGAIEGARDDVVVVAVHRKQLRFSRLPKNDQGTMPCILQMMPVKWEFLFILIQGPDPNVSTGILWDAPKSWNKLFLLNLRCLRKMMQNGGGLTKKKTSEWKSGTREIKEMRNVVEVATWLKLSCTKCYWKLCIFHDMVMHFTQYFNLLSGPWQSYWWRSLEKVPTIPWCCTLAFTSGAGG